MNKKKVILGSGILVILIVAMTLIWTNFCEKPVEGSKEITIEVVNSKEESEVYELKTDAEYFLQAMEEAKEEGMTFDGEDGQFGFTVITVNGEKADFNEGTAYWSFYVNDEYCSYGVSDQPVEDKDEFKIVYTKME